METRVQLQYQIAISHRVLGSLMNESELYQSRTATCSPVFHTSFPYRFNLILALITNQNYLISDTVIEFYEKNHRERSRKYTEWMKSPIIESTSIQPYMLE